MKLQDETKYKQWRNVKLKIDFQKRLIIELEKQSEEEVREELERLRNSCSKLIKQEENLIRTIVSDKLKDVTDEDLWEWR